MKQLLTTNKYFFGSVILFSVLESILLAITTKVEITLWVNTHGYVMLDKSLLFIDNGGTTLFSIAAVLLLWICKGWRMALKASACLVPVMIVTQFAKYILFPGTPRPTLYFEPGALRLIEGVKQLTTESFPSGHTSASFALATFFALYWPHKQWHWILALLAFTVSYARVYLSQHFITDVYAGMLLGVIFTALIFYFYPYKWETKHK
ncbi:MAG: phosphatase PAP2 family protein [Dysgonamonadaceae bacterium]|jgi:membrane-associated phospholipid phosphatase|nr:phosphatase PAP2 family protein [Dysgonamonadaceae bacterium]